MLRTVRIASLLCALPSLVYGISSKACITPETAALKLNKDICVAAHVYDVVELQDGTRFLDVCSPQTPDEQCRFTIMSLPQDRREVGDVARYRGSDMHMRGVVQPLHGRAGMILSHARQFSGGAPKFRPNPLLTRGFSAEDARGPVNDPNLRRQGGRRAFMNTRDQVPLR